MQEDTRYNELATRYFELIRELRTGVEGAPERLVEMWDPEGVFEFAGSPDINGTFTGVHAINVLYRNRFAANGMPLRLVGGTDKEEKESKDRGQVETALGVVDTDVNRVRALDDGRVVAGWTTTVGTRDQQGFQVSGSHTFTFKDDKIANLRVVVTPQADKADGLDPESLTVEDIGRLSLAAWMVV